MKDQETVQQFIELRSQGVSFTRIAAKPAWPKAPSSSGTRRDGLDAGGIAPNPE